MPQVTKEQVSLRQKDRKKKPSVYFSPPGCRRASSVSKVVPGMGLSHGGSSLELQHQRSFQPSHAALGH